ncbi:MAG TPA: hypothetical protein VKA36_05890, partial [Solirubrobacterales bacterium]|nr:hypothetical protein [Solirubrobacterales bacterium]
MHSSLPRHPTRGLALLAPALVAIALACSSPPDAHAGEYTLVQCDPSSRDDGAARFDRTDGAYYGFGRHCSDPARSSALKVRNLAAAPTGAEGRISWIAPGGTSVVGVSAEARLRRDGDHRARLSFLDSAGRPAGRIATGRDAPGGFERHSARLHGTGRAGFAAQLVCISGVRCAESDQARTWVRSVRLTLRDAVAPTVSASGTLLGDGWQRGERSLGVHAGDVGGGLRNVDVAVGGVRVAPSRVLACALAGAGLARVPRPCPAGHSGSASFLTDRPPFVNGSNRVTVCARDYGAGPNQRCLARDVRVDNEPPRAHFLTRDPADPELISAEV